MIKVESDNYSSVSYPFAIYKDFIIEQQESLIHINLFAQMYYEAFAKQQTDGIKMPLILVNDRFVVVGIGEPGIYKMNFKQDKVDKIGNMRMVDSSEASDSRLGLIYEQQSEKELFSRIEQFKRIIHIHGELRDLVEYVEIEGEKLAIQWIMK